jgi:hypothetical protein
MRRIFFLCLALFSFACTAGPVFAATTTVCASGCDFTTISDALLAGPGAGDVVTVGATYASTTESFPFNVNPGVTLDCQNSGAVIGVDTTSTPVNINSQGQNTIRACSFNNVGFQNTNVEGVTFRDNAFAGNAAILMNNSTSIHIIGNDLKQRISADQVQDLEIDSNTVVTEQDYVFPTIQISHSTSVTVTNNDIRNDATTMPSGFGVMLLGQGGIDSLVATNTIRTPNMIFSSGGDLLHIQSELVRVYGNQFTISGQTPGSSYINAIHLDGNDTTSSADIVHNTIKMKDSNSRGDGITINDWVNYSIFVTSTYNIIYREAPSSTAQNGGFAEFNSGLAEKLAVFTEYNGFWNLNGNDVTDLPMGSNSITDRDPAFRTLDADTTNDFTLAPYSSYLDVLGTNDIGAVPGVRGTDFHIDQFGTIDYAAVDATDTALLVSNLRGLETVHFADGDYSAVHAPSVAAKLTLIGAGSGSIIHATTTNSSALSLPGGSAHVSRLTFADATSTQSATYAITHALYTYASVNYNQTSGFFGSDDLMLVLEDTSCGVDGIASDGFDVTTPVGAATDDWNLGLLNVGGAHLTMFVPNNVAASGAALSGIISGVCGAANTVDQFIPSVYVANGDGTFSYNASAVAGASATQNAGDTAPPAISRTLSFGTAAGISLADSSGNVFTNVTSTANGNGVLFDGTAAENAFINSAFTGNLGYDVNDASANDNRFFDTTFAVASTTFSGAGVVKVHFSARVFTENLSTGGLASTNVTAVSANSVSSTTLTSDGSGYSPYAMFPAYTLSSSGNTVISGGFNSYTFSHATDGSLQASSTNVRLLTPFQTVRLAMTASMFFLTASAVNGVPSVNLTPRRRWKV